MCPVKRAKFVMSVTVAAHCFLCTSMIGHLSPNLTIHLQIRPRIWVLQLCWCAFCFVSVLASYRQFLRTCPLCFLM